MGELEVHNELPNVFTGELMPVADADKLAGYLDLVREKVRELHAIRAEVEQYLVEHFEREGSKTIRTENHEIVLTGGEETVYDPTVLLELLDRGLPQKRFDQLVTTHVSYKVSAAQAKRIAGANPEYAEVVQRATTVVEKPYRVNVKR